MSNLFNRYQELSSAPLEHATSLPFEVYHDKEVFKLEADKVFHKEWVFVCAEQAIAKPGSYFAFDLAGEAVTIIRGQDSELRAMSNNCRHRGTPLLDEGFGEIEKNITCPYHAWTYDDKGTLKGVPLPGNIKVDKTIHCLPQFQLSAWSGLLFINLDKNAPPLSEKLKNIENYTNIFEPNRFDSYTSGPLEHWQANWKLAMENAMETYHIFKVHKDTLETVGPTRDAYHVAGSSDWTITGGKTVDDSSKLTQWFRGDYPEAYNHYQVIILPPSFVGILNYDSLSWIHVLPKDNQSSTIRSGALTPKSSFKEDKQSQALTEAFFAEDKWICERAQRGMTSKVGSGGKLVELEKPLVDFHQYLASKLFEENTDAFCEGENADIFKI